MPRLTLRTLLAYLDDTLAPTEAKSLGRKVADSEEARELVERIKRVTRRRGLKTPVPATAADETADPNTVAEYLDNTLDSATLKQVEETCLSSDVHLAEVAAVHQILTLVLTEPVRVPPRAHRRMYGLVPPPASRPKRRPNKKLLPVSGARPVEPERHDADDADAALLLGLKRYSASESWAGRFALLGIGAALAAMLAVAVYMALPHRGPAAPESAGPNSFAQLTPTAPTPETPVPKPKEKEPETTPPKKPKDPDPVVLPKPFDPNTMFALGAAVATEAAAANADPGPNLADPVAAPDKKVAEIGRLETPRALVVVQDQNAPDNWLRLNARPGDDEPVMSNVPIMALPGYKANLLVGPRDKQVQVQLWGNVPEQLPYRVFESRVQFHAPAAGFDADLTLFAGRIYLKSKKLDGDRKPTGAKVRVRVAGEVWDITLATPQSDVLVELISWFEPGVMYSRADGPAPKLEGRVAVTAGTAAFAAPRRFKTVPKLALNTQVSWDSGSGSLSEPRAVPSPQEATATPTLDGEFLKVITRLLTEAADKVDDRAVTRPVMERRIDPPAGTAERDLVARLAVYSQAALSTPTEAGAANLKPLVDVLKSELPFFVRQSVVTTLAAWVARERGNTALLRAVLVSKGIGEDGDNDDAADRLLRLLRAFVSPTKPDPDRLDALGKLLEDKDIPVREAALWNLVAVELETWLPPPAARVNIGAVGAAVNGEDYKKFLAYWRAKIEMLKKREVPVPLPRPVPK